MELRQLEHLLHDKDFKLELRAYRKACQRLRTRFRNNPFTGQLRQLANMTKELQRTYSVDSLKAYNDHLIKLGCREQENNEKQHEAIKRYLKFLHNMVQLCQKLIVKTVEIYAGTQPRIKVGHLVHHYVIVRASLARIRICMKALLIYTCDLYIDICTKYSFHGDGEKLPNCEKIRTILIENRCKPKNVGIKPIDGKDESTAMELDVDKTIKSEYKEEKIGQLIDRKTLKPK